MGSLEVSLPLQPLLVGLPTVRFQSNAMRFLGILYRTSIIPGADQPAFAHVVDDEEIGSR